jgi:signal transduction histidine kinase
VIWNEVVSNVAQAGVPQVLHRGADGWDGAARGTPLRETLETFGIGSIVVAPLAGHEAVLGTIALAVEAPRRFDRLDIEMVEELARRVALALDNSRLYRKAQEAISVRDEFLSIASHELRTPLTPLQLLLQGLLRRLEDRPAEEIPAELLRGTLARSERQVKRLARLIDALLDVSRISAGKLDLTPEKFDLADLVREVVGRLSVDAADQERTVTVDCEGPIVGCWDRLRLEQVLSNLIANAIKYGGDEPFTISVKRNGSAAQIQVSDRGIGISADKIERIFDRYERGVSSVSYGGLGLGLYIAKQIVDAHGGTIAVTSQVGVGSTFTVELPLPPGQPVPALGPEFVTDGKSPDKDGALRATEIASIS